MATLSKRSTIYLDPALHQALRIKSVETSRSMSDIINEIVKEALAEDAEDLSAFDQRTNGSGIFHGLFGVKRIIDSNHHFLFHMSIWSFRIFPSKFF